MSLFGSIQLGANTLQAMQIGLQVTGNNIANANTPGYVRQEVIYSPAPVQKIGNLMLGLGVQVDAIVDKIDKFVHDRLVGARGDRAGAEVQEDAYNEIENLLNGLSGETDLSTSFTNFFNSIGGVLDDPSNAAARNLVITQGDTLATTLNNLSQPRARRSATSSTTGSSLRPTKSTRSPKRFASSTSRSPPSRGAAHRRSDAGGLRVERQKRDRPAVGDPRHHCHRADERRGQHLGRRRVPGIRRPAQSVEVDDRRRTTACRSRTVQFADTNRRSNPATGELPGLYAARDEIVGDFLDGLDQLAGLFAFEFNKLHSQGQGLVGFDELTSVNVDRRRRRGARRGRARVHAGQRPFPSARLQQGRSEITEDARHFHPARRPRRRHDAQRPDGRHSTRSTASRRRSRRPASCKSLPIRATRSLRSTATPAASWPRSDSIRFSPARRPATSASTASCSGLGNEAKFAASGGGLGPQSDSAQCAGAFQVSRSSRSTRPADSTVPDVYDRLVNAISQGATVAGSIAEGFRVFENTLDGQLQAVARREHRRRSDQSDHAAADLSGLGASSFRLPPSCSTSLIAISNRESSLPWPESSRYRRLASAISSSASDWSARCKADQLDLFRLQTQVSTGRRILRRATTRRRRCGPSPCSGRFSAKSSRSEISPAAGRCWKSAETSLNSVADTLRDRSRRGARDREQSDVVRSRGRRRSPTIDAALSSLITSGNANYNGRYLFAGSRTNELPFSLDGDFVEYRGNEKSLQNYVDLEQLFTTNLPGTDVFGGISGEVRGTADLNPQLTEDTLLSSINGGNGLNTERRALDQRHQRRRHDLEHRRPERRSDDRRRDSADRSQSAGRRREHPRRHRRQRTDGFHDFAARCASAKLRPAVRPGNSASSRRRRPCRRRRWSAAIWIPVVRLTTPLSDLFGTKSQRSARSLATRTTTSSSLRRPEWHRL